MTIFRSFRRAVTLVVVGALAGAVPVLSHGGIAHAMRAAATGPYTCTGFVYSTTIYGNVVVPSGATCTLEEVTVTGNVTMASTSTLNLFGSTVDSSVTGQNALLLSIESSIHGTLSLTQGAAYNILYSQIGGRVTLDHTYGNICSSTLRGSYTATNSVLELGDPDEDNCGANTVGGSVTVGSSVGEIESNTIGGAVNLSSTFIELSGNSIGGSASCGGNTPVDDGDSTPNTARGKNTC